MQFRILPSIVLVGPYYRTNFQVHIFTFGYLKVIQCRMSRSRSSHNMWFPISRP